MTNAVAQQKPEKLKKSSWWWPGVVVTSLARAAVVVFRGCWHGRMSWPVRVQGYSDQVCLSCGAMRLFDEKTFNAYGPFRYDLNELIAWEKSTKPKSRPVANGQGPTVTIKRLTIRRLTIRRLRIRRPPGHCPRAAAPRL